VPAQRSCNISSTRYWPEKDANEFRNCDGEEDLGFKTNLSNSGTICSNTELEKANIIDITNEELSLEDRQAMEEFMKKKAEQDRQAIKELMKEMAEKINSTTCRTSRRIIMATSRKPMRSSPSILHLPRYHPMLPLMIFQLW
jgi:hypothetical protein